MRRPYAVRPLFCDDDVIQHGPSLAQACERVKLRDQSANLTAARTLIVLHF